MRVSGTTDKESRAFVVKGRLVRVASLRSNWWVGMPEPEAALRELRTAGVKADVFTFMQRLPDVLPRYAYHMEWDNVAAIPVSTYENWWLNQLNCKTRNMIRKSEKAGVTVRVAFYDDDFVHGIKQIQDETPIRQGRPFAHYGKAFEVVKAEHASYLDRSDFIGAYWGDHMIGFAKLVYDEGFATLMNIVSLLGERDKAPNNGLVAKAVERCASKHIPYLVYSKYVYGKKGEDDLARFKRHNAFEKVDIPQYFIPLNVKGRVALACGLHRGLRNIVPKRLLVVILGVRNRVNDWRSARRGT